jgi:hypothetical protein
MKVPLVPLVDLMSPDDEHEGCHDRQIVGDQVAHA